MLPSAVLTKGLYTVGENADIPPGRYIIVFEYSNEHGNSDGNDYSYLHVKIREPASFNSEVIYLSNHEFEHPDYSITLVEGNKLFIDEDAAIRLVKTETPVFE